ncbi:MAG: TIGR03032 family protein [Kaiparowitsia implicata GSE-PSE-MK54-09C]|nr:TIGR03032 family protein [Kaiparowitsia implicata GSE-PSE-MK54-09C]
MPESATRLRMIGSAEVAGWLQAEQLSLACTTYQTNRLLLIGATPQGQLSGYERIFDQAMGLYATPQRLFLSTQYQIWQLDQVLRQGQAYEGCTQLYVPRVGYTTGNLDIHDVVALPGDGETPRLIFVATVLNCLATVGDRHSCRPLWMPPFISQLINEDRCHLNGLAVVDDAPKYVTVVSQSDVVDGWRDRRQEGGAVLDVPSGEVVVSGLSMPHSPRWYGDRLWVLNSGRGEFGYVDVAAGRFEPVAFCPGYLRGLAFWKHWAIVGLSKSRRDDATFGGLALDDLLQQRGAEPQCGLVVINLRTGTLEHWLRLEGGLITELYDVQVLPAVQQAMVLGFQTDEIAKLITLEPMGSLNDTGRDRGRSPQDRGRTIAPMMEFATAPHSPLPAAPTPSAVFLPREEANQDANQEADSLERAEAAFQRSITQKQQGQLAAAEASLNTALSLNAQHWMALNNLGTLMQQQGRLTEALACYERVLRAKPDLVEAIANRASVWQTQGDLERAKPEFQRVIQRQPDYLPAHLNLAHLYKQQGRLQAAVDHFRQVIALDAAHADAYFQLGQILEYQDQLLDALDCYETVLRLNPKAHYVTGFSSFLRMQLCDWRDYDQRIQDLVALTEAGIRGESVFSPNPYILNFFPLAPELHHAAAKSQAKQFATYAATAPNPLPPPADSTSGPKLRIGYLSPDFRDHAVGRLVYQIFQQHDRSRYEVFAYATIDAYDVITEQIERGCDRFLNLATYSHRDAAAQIRDDGVQVLIDLAGYTIGSGAAILAHQPAPVQALFLGYPATMGAPFVQYILGDRWILPPDIAAHYSEQVIYLPHAFVGSALGVSDRPLTRAEFGLPAEGVVFACFNTHRKITPDLFAAWMEILRQVPTSVLWLMTGLVDETNQNLRHAAQQHGIDSDRLIFRDRSSYADYLAQYQLVDLVLDTFIYSAGSTAIAALWGGAPMLTRPGPTNASRMGASICAAAQLDKLICTSTEDYIAKAIYYATHTAERNTLRQHLISQRHTLPLFNVGQFTRDLEAAIEQIKPNVSNLSSG